MTIEKQPKEDLMLTGLDVETPMEKMDNSLKDIFNTDGMVIGDMELSTVNNNGLMVIDEPSSVSKVTNGEIDKDAKSVRENLEQLMNTGNSALKYALELAKVSDSPRAFEVVGTLLKTMADMNMQIMETHEKEHRMAKPDTKAPQKVINNQTNNILAGTTKDINKLIEERMKEVK